MLLKLLMASYLAVLSIVSYASVKTEATQTKDPGVTIEPEIPVYRCLQCEDNCSDSICLVAKQCPEERPTCATVASAPNFTSSLVCSVRFTEVIANKPCTLSFNDGYLQEMRCFCSEDACNKPFSKELEAQLTNFSLSFNTNHTEEAFWKHFPDNFKEAAAYRDKLVFRSPESEANASLIIDDEENMVVPGQLPHAEALKRETPMPSDDDEDDSEGSGLGEELHTPRSPSAAPAAPSSYRPADDSDAASAAATAAFHATLFALVPLLVLF